MRDLVARLDVHGLARSDNVLGRSAMRLATLVLNRWLCLEDHGEILRSLLHGCRLIHIEHVTARRLFDHVLKIIVVFSHWELFGPTCFKVRDVIDVLLDTRSCFFSLLGLSQLSDAGQDRMTTEADRVELDVLNFI